MIASDPKISSGSATAVRIAAVTGTTTALVTGGTAMAIDASASSLALLALGAAAAGLAAGAAAYWIANRTLTQALARTDGGREMRSDPSRPAFPASEGGLEPMIDRALNESRDSGSMLSALAIAIDRLDEIELGLGLDIVQAIKSEIFTRLRAITRSNEPLVERPGGMMMLVMRYRVDEHEDIGLAQRLLDQFQPLIDIGGERIKVSLSVGIARQSLQTSSAGALLRQAEVALYEAQRLGGRQHLLYTADIDDIFETRSRIAHELAEAVENRKGLGMVYQPILDTDRSDMAGAEALVRWNHPIYGRLDRRLLIEIAEAADLMVPLGDWLLDMALGQLARSGLPWMAVNVSSEQLRAPQFVERLAVRLQQMRLSPERLHFEIAPDAIRDASLEAPLAAMRKLGVRLALDAFEKPEDIAGPADWRTFPFDRIDEIKLAAALVPAPGQDFGTEAALWSMAGHARAQGVKLSAKGIETEAQRQMFARLGISQMQGLLYAPPTTALTLESIADRPMAS